MKNLIKLGSSHEGRAIWMVKIGRGAAGELTPRWFFSLQIYHFHSKVTKLFPLQIFHTIMIFHLVSGWIMIIFLPPNPISHKIQTPLVTRSWSSIMLVDDHDLFPPSKFSIFTRSWSSSMLVDGGMHAREWVTVGTAVSLIGHLVNNIWSLMFPNQFDTW